MATLTKRFYQFGPFRIDAEKRVLLRVGEVVPLKPKAFDTLLVLVQHHGEVLEKDNLMEMLWPDSDVAESNLPQHISALRKALGESPNERRYIVTVPGRGYRFAARVIESNEESSEFIVGSYSESTLVIQEQNHDEGENSETRKSLAVLPFKQWDVQGGEEYLGLGIADTLITKLSNLRGVLVRPTSAVVRYAVQHTNSMEAGRDLGVESVLEGSIRRLGDRLRVTVQLVRVQDGSSLWASKFDGKFTDIFAVEDSISEMVAQSLFPKLTGKEREAVIKRYTENTEAYQLYLKGRYYWNKFTPEAVKKSIDYFQQATEKDPRYTLALAGLSDCYVSLPFNSDAPPREVFPKAKQAAERALDIDDQLAEAHAAMGSIVFLFDWHREKAESHFKRAIDLNPNYPLGRFWDAHLLSNIGRFEEAAMEARRALELDPLSLLFNAIMGQFLFEARQYDLAIDQLQKALEIEPNFWITHVVLAKVYAQKGMYSEALIESQKALQFSGGNTEASSLIGYTYAVSGNQKQAEKVLGELKELSKQKYVPASNIALIYVGLGETNPALDWLEKAYDERCVHMTFLKVASYWDRIRKESRFTSLLQRAGF
jgi:DNA-binding winged helix-turn-helix (wHTH) protein/Flp pilus assembly protein TadD